MSTTGVEFSGLPSPSDENHFGVHYCIALGEDGYE